jgi:hypothetical protein
LSGLIDEKKAKDQRGIDPHQPGNRGLGRTLICQAWESLPSKKNGMGPYFLYFLVGKVAWNLQHLTYYEILFTIYRKGLTSRELELKCSKTNRNGGGKRS